MDNNNWDSLNPVLEKEIDIPQTIDWSMEVYNNVEFTQTHSVTPNYSVIEFYKR